MATLQCSDMNCSEFWVFGLDMIETHLKKSPALSFGDMSRDRHVFMKSVPCCATVYWVLGHVISNAFYRDFSDANLDWNSVGCGGPIAASWSVAWACSQLLFNGSRVGRMRPDYFEAHMEELFVKRHVCSPLSNRCLEVLPCMQLVALKTT